MVRFDYGLCYTSLCNLVISSAERPVQSQMVWKESPLRSMFTAISLRPCCSPFSSPFSSPFCKPSSRPFFLRVLQLVVCVPCRLHIVDVILLVFIIKAGNFRYIEDPFENLVAQCRWVFQADPTGSSACTAICPGRWSARPQSC